VQDHRAGARAGAGAGLGAEADCGGGYEYILVTDWPGRVGRGSAVPVGVLDITYPTKRWTQKFRIKKHYFCFGF